MVFSDVVYFFLLLTVIPITPITAAAAVPAYKAADFILLNCGAKSGSISNDSSGRSWVSDDGLIFVPPYAARISTVAKASSMHPSVSQIPFETARIFTSPFTYTFLLSAGAKFLRLYFYAADQYSGGYDTSLSLFSVTANGFTLLSNFSATLNSPSPSNPSFMKEYVVAVEANQKLNLTFTPNPISFAFVNGIEIVSMPDTLYFMGNDVPIKFADQLAHLINDIAVENVYRLNVGGGDVPIGEDSGMFRAWAQDNDFIFGADYGNTPNDITLQVKYTDVTRPSVAPEIVYKTCRVMTEISSSLEWRFPVDSGFYYLLRLHFCELQLEVTGQNQRVFTISINNQTAEIKADVFAWTGGKGIPIFKDYMTWVPDDGRRGKKFLSLSLFPSMKSSPKYESALLNGLEIFKLSIGTSRSLAAANPYPRVISPQATAVNRPAKSRRTLIYAVFGSVGSVVGALVVASAMGLLILRRRRRVKDSATTSTASRSKTRTIATNMCRNFSLDEIKTATGNFDANSIIGKGGFGNVYRGLIDGGTTTVAIKRLNPSSNQGAREFLTEIEMLSNLRHLHLVSLIGYCDEKGEMILIYDYMANGTLRDHLYGRENPSLTWHQRLRVCTGAAKGLDYLHTATKNSIIHRDVKSTNILLDDRWAAKVSDFGLSKVGPASEGGQTHISTAVKGSFGYMDPEYYRRQQLTDKSDVYSFGVVLFEVLCGRAAIVIGLPQEQVNLAEWAEFCCREGTIRDIVDTSLEGQVSPECLAKFVETAVACLRDKGIERPTMSDVVRNLEFAMQFQTAAENSGLESSNDVSQSKSNGCSGNLMSEDVFSEIKNPLPR